MFTVTGKSESDDVYGPVIFINEPTDEQLSNWAHACDGCLDKSGPGFDGSYVYVDVCEAEFNYDIVILKNGEWSGLYFNGDKISEGGHLSAQTILELLGIDYTIRETINMPKYLED